MASVAPYGVNKCPALNKTFHDGYPRPFVATFAITYVHENTPRFGHTNNVTYVISGTNEQAWDYLWGVLSGPILIFCIFLFWIAILVVLRCLGDHRVGFWSGKSMKIPTKPVKPEAANGCDGASDDEDDQETAVSGDPAVEDVADPQKPTPSDEENPDQQKASHHEQQLAEWNQAVQKREKRLRRIRAVVLFCGTCIVTFAIVMITMGVTNLIHALHHTHGGIADAAKLCDEIANKIDQFQTIESKLLTEAQNVTFALDGFCPSIQDVPCDNPFNYSACNAVAGIPGREAITSFLSEGQTYLRSQLTEVQVDIEEMSVYLHDLEYKLKSFYWAFWLAASFAAVIALLTIFVMIGVTRACLGYKQNRLWASVHSLVLVPLYIVLLSLSFIFSMVFIIGSVVTADFCFHSPDERVLAILQMMRDNFESYFFLLLKYYVEGCVVSHLPLDIGTVRDTLHAVAGSIISVNNYLATNEEYIELLCGSGTNTALVITGLASDAACKSFTVFFDINQLLACTTWHPIYSSFAYDAICYSGNTAFTWIAWSQFLIVFFAMIMLTLRIAFSDARREEDEEELGRCEACCRRTFCCAAPPQTNASVEDAPPEAAVIPAVGSTVGSAASGWLGAESTTSEAKSAGMEKPAKSLTSEETSFISARSLMRGTSEPQLEISTRGHAPFATSF